MDLDQFRQLDRPALADYLWRRLRREPPLDPPLGTRFGDEEPEQFIIQAVEQTDDLSIRRGVLQAVKDNLQQLARQRAAQGDTPTDDKTTDDQIASLAFLISELNAKELVQPLYRFACGWFIGAEAESREPSFGQTHLLRTLAHLQDPGWLASFWQTLWERGPRALRGLTIFGWARAAPQDALANLGELADSADTIDLPATLWSLIGPEGPGIVQLAKAARRCPTSQRSALRQALQEAGAEQHTLRDFDLYADSQRNGNGQLPWLDALVPDSPSFARRAPQWAGPGVAA